MAAKTKKPRKKTAKEKHEEYTKAFYAHPEKACANLKNGSKKKYDDCIAHAKRITKDQGSGAIIGKAASKVIGKRKKK